MAEKVFHFYEDLLPELREVVVEEMEPEDRCRFTRCSKLSQKEAKSSKNIIFSLKLYASSGFACIRIGYNPEHEGKWLFIEQDPEKKYLICKNENNSELWRDELDSSTNIGQYGAELFKELLAEHQNKIKLLDFEMNQRSLGNYDFGIRNLNNLESLRIDGSIYLLQEYFSKLRKPLKCLTVNSIGDTIFLADCEEIYQVRDKIVLSQRTLSYQQMLRLRAKTVTIPIYDITEMDICNFIQSWQNGTLGKEVKSYRWTHFRGYSFDVPRLFRLLGCDYNAPANRRESKSFTINHNTDARKRAILRYDNIDSELLFKVEDD